jgi:8-oxo-dGTP diphosphatase
MERDTFLVGVNAIVVRNNKILLGKRKNVVGDGKWGLPGGHMEHNESIQDAAARELMEETGMTATSWKFLNVMNDPEAAEKHFIHFSLLAQDTQGEPELKEPDVCHGWEWFDLGNLPENIFGSHKRRIRAFLDNQIFIDSETSR